MELNKLKNRLDKVEKTKSKPERFKLLIILNLLIFIRRVEKDEYFEGTASKKKDAPGSTADFKSLYPKKTEERIMRSGDKFHAL